MTKVRKAIIPAAGLGTRFLPATKAQPKEMMPIVDKPAIQYIVEEAVASGIEEILIITGRNKRAIEDHFDRSIELELALERQNRTELLEMVQKISEMTTIYYVRQKDPKGLGHAVNCAATFVGNEPFAVMLGDDIVDSREPCLKQLIQSYEKHQCSILGVQQVDPSQVNKYGIVDGNKIDERTYHINSLIEKPQINQSPSNIAILGRYIITPGVFQILDTLEPGASGEIQLTDALNLLTQQEEMKACIFEGKRYDIGDKMGFLEATVEFALKVPDLSEDFDAYLKQLVRKRNQI